MYHIDDGNWGRESISFSYIAYFELDVVVELTGKNVSILTILNTQ